MIFKIKPLSVNKCWQGRRFKTPEYKRYETELSIIIKKQKMPKHKGNVGINIKVSYKNKLNDIDNFIKPLFDILVKNNIIEDDRYIMELKINKFIDKNEHLDIEIYNLD